MTALYGKIDRKSWLHRSPPQIPPVPADPMQKRPLVSPGGRSDMPVRPNVERTWLRKIGHTQGGGKVVLEP